jgi:hypothetical protein
MNSNQSLALKIDTSDLEIPLRYYKGWTITFRTKTESFCSEILCLYGFSNTKDLEKAIDFAIEKRNNLPKTYVEQHRLLSNANNK